MPAVYLRAVSGTDRCCWGNHLLTMDKPYFSVDFNEMIDANTVLLSAGDWRIDAGGVIVQLREGMLVRVYMDDLRENGKIDNLVANGVVTKKHIGGVDSERKVVLSNRQRWYSTGVEKKRDPSESEMGLLSVIYNRSTALTQK